MAATVAVTRSNRPGRDVALERLLELLLVEVIAAAPLQRPRPVRPPGQPCRPLHRASAPGPSTETSSVAGRWPASERPPACRGRCCGQFSRVVGVPPIDYLLRWPMPFAKDALQSGHERLVTIAEKTGHQSVSAFSRTVGWPPSRFASEQDGARVQPDPDRQEAIQMWSQAFALFQESGPARILWISDIVETLRRGRESHANRSRSARTTKR